ncbi:dTMP kinase [Actinoallomurus rhizosphaericola]|uniref:dTMP kinase n=1 Tax=Actinoallomurus rhizosphaericola TaxID=2952536 RepID=UPI0020937AB9|nr:dTMP kinase [Actinoallomurus rhizosphaericola]MCO5995794.1 dTMP kinase [Actinoallomurus rhizosphaericola]
MTRTGSSSGVLSIKPFRRLWIALSLSSFGDWLSILALTALAGSLTKGSAEGYAIGGVLVVKLLPALVFGPLAGAVADRFDRRTTMVIADILRFSLFLSIPIIGRLDWLYVATFLVEIVTLFWIPAKEATVPNLVPKDRLERANQISLISTYGSAPVAAGTFSVLALISGVVFSTHRQQANLALYINAVTFLVSAVTIFSLREIPRQGGKVSVPSVLKQIVAGWRFVGSTPMVRGLTVGIVGAFAAGGAVIGVAKVYVKALGGGDAAYGVVFGMVFVGMAIGMFLGPRILKDFSRRRLFGLAIIGAGVALALIAVIENLVIVALLTALLGAGAGIAWVIGYTLVGLEVEDSLRGRTWAFLQSLVRVVLLLTVAAVPFIANAVGEHRIKVADAAYHFDGPNAVLLLGAVVAVIVGLLAYRQMDDRKGIPLSRDLLAALRGEEYVPEEAGHGERGVFLAFEGGEGAGKTTQARLLAIWLRDQGFDVVTTREPGSTKIGMRLRALLLDKETSGLSARAETMLYAADRAQHVAEVIRPALERGAIVVTDRYVDSSLAYQGAGRELKVKDIAEVNRWATGGLTPDLTIVLDVPSEIGLNRFASPADRIESEPREFHERVRRGFRALAEAEPHRYLVIDAAQPQEDITRQIRDRVRAILPDPVPATAEAVTSTMPVITD